MGTQEQEVNVNKEQAKAVQTEVGEAIKAVYAKHGLTVTTARATFGDSEFNLTVKAVSAATEDRAKTWNQYAPLFGLPADAVGEVVTINRKAYRIVGLDLNRRKYPVRAEEVATGKVLLFQEESVRRALADRISVEA